MATGKTQDEKDKELMLKFVKTSADFLVAVANRNDLSLSFNLEDNIKKLKSTKPKIKKGKTKK